MRCTGASACPSPPHESAHLANIVTSLRGAACGHRTDVRFETFERTPQGGRVDDCPDGHQGHAHGDADDAERCPVDTSEHGERRVWREYDEWRERRTLRLGGVGHISVVP